jgi:hypothetical protein
MERTQPGIILRACLLELDVVAHHADNIRLLLDRLRQINGGGHAQIFSVERRIVQSDLSPYLHVEIRVAVENQHTIQPED